MEGIDEVLFPNPESGHCWRGQCHDPISSLLDKQWNNASLAPHQISMPNHIKSGAHWIFPIGLDQFHFHEKFGVAVDVDRVDSLISRIGNDSLDSTFSGDGDDVSCADDICFMSLDGIEFHDMNVLHSSSMKNERNALHGFFETFKVSYVTDH